MGGGGDTGRNLSGHCSLRSQCPIMKQGNDRTAKLYHHTNFDHDTTNNGREKSFLQVLFSGPSPAGPPTAYVVVVGEWRSNYEVARASRSQPIISDLFNSGA